MSIIKRAEIILALIKKSGDDGCAGVWLQGKSGLSVEEVNEAVAYLENVGKVDLILDDGESFPFHFMEARISEG